MTDEEFAELLRKHVTLHHRYRDSGGWDAEERYAKEHPEVSLFDEYVHRNFLALAKRLVADLEGEVDRETIIKVIKAL